MNSFFGACPRLPLLTGILGTLLAITSLGAQSFEINVLPPDNVWLDNSAAPVQQGALVVLVLQGQKAVNSIPERRGTTPVVEVRSQNGLPIEGAEVVFTLPASGPGGLFSTGQRTATVLTNADGQAAVPFTVNDKPGDFQIQVSAKSGDLVGSAVITQTNSSRSSEHVRERNRPWYRTWKIWAVAGGAGAAAAAIIIATHGGSSSSTPTITITPGPPTVSHP